MLRDKTGLYLVVLMCLFSLIILDDLILIYLVLEIQSFTLYILFNLDKKLLSIKSTLILFFLNGLFSFFFIMYFIYYNNNLLVYYLNILFVYKMGLFPFFFWVKDVYKGLTFYNILLLIIIPKISYFIVLYKILIFDFTIIIILSILFSAIIGINQTRLKEILAYSSILNISIIFFMLTKANNLFIYYLLLYSYFVIALLLILRYNYMLEYSSGFLNVNIFLILLFVITISGIPPLTGFFLKLTFLYVIFFNDNLTFFLFVIIGLSISLFIYLRFINYIIIYKKLNFLLLNNKIYYNTYVITYLSIFFFIITNFFVKII